LENNIQTIDQIYFYDAEQDKENVAQKPWKNE
jgi:COP9 signalosome complex subunit 5